MIRDPNACIFAFQTDWRPERRSHLAILTREMGDGSRRLVNLGGEKLDLSPGAAIPDDQIDWFSDEVLRQMMQVIVNEAHTRFGISPYGHKHDLGAMIRHLEDMRSMAFHKIGAEKPK